MSSFNRYFKKFDEFNPELIEFKEFKEGKGKSKALNSYPSNGEYKIQTCEIEYTARGFPPKMEDQPDQDRNYFQLGLDPENPEHIIFIDNLNKLTEHLNSDKVREQLFGKNVKKFSTWKVKPTVRNLDEEGKVPFVKANFDIDYNNEGKIKTIIFLKINDEVSEVPTSDYCNSIDDLIKIVPYRSKIVFQLIVSKVWTMASSKDYGVGFKIHKMVVEPPHSDGGGDSKGYDFISDKKVTIKKSNTLTIADIDSSDDENIKTTNEDDTDNPEEVVIKKEVVTKKEVVIKKEVVTKKEIVDTSDDEEVVVKKPVKKQVDSDDSDEEVVMKKEVKKEVKKELKKEIAEVDTSDDEEVVVKKPVKKQVDSDEEVVVKKSVKKQVDSDEEVVVKKSVKKQDDSDDSDEEIIRPSKALADNDSDDSDEA